jgi:hypothetical protein
MKGCSFASKIKNLFCSAPENIALSEVISQARNSFTALLLRPGNDNQKSLMIEQFFYAQKELWSGGGYVISNRKDAGDVVRVLSELSIPYELFSLSDTKEHNLIHTLASAREDKNVFVYIDDERDHLLKRTEDFRRFQAKVIDKCRDWKDDPKDANWDFLPTFYVDVDLPSMSGFMVYMAQVRKRIGYCMLTSKSWQDIAVSQRLGIMTEKEVEEYKSVKANSITIYGSGRRNHKEAMGSHFTYLNYKAAALNTQQPDFRTGMKSESEEKALSPFREETNLGLSTLYGDQAIYIDLNR